MPSAVWIERAGRVAFFRLRFGHDEFAAEVLCQAADFKDAGGVSSCRVDVQGSCGVHGVDSLCGGRVSQISTSGCQ